VLDKNDNEPEFLFPSPLNNTVYLSSYAPPDHVVTHVTSRHVVTHVIAVDADDGDNGLVTYRVVEDSGRPQPEVESFRLDSESGTVVVARPLDSVDHRTFKLNILAVDHGVPAKYASEMIAFIPGVLTAPIVVSFLPTLEHWSQTKVFWRQSIRCGSTSALAQFAVRH